MSTASAAQVQYIRSLQEKLSYRQGFSTDHDAVSRATHGRTYQQLASSVAWRTTPTLDAYLGSAQEAVDLSVAWTRDLRDWALDADPETMTTAEASHLIDVLKGEGRHFDIERPVVEILPKPDADAPRGWRARKAAAEAAAQA